MCLNSLGELSTTMSDEKMQDVIQKILAPTNRYNINAPFATYVQEHHFESSWMT